MHDRVLDGEPVDTGNTSLDEGLAALLRDQQLPEVVGSFGRPTGQQRVR
ncbi:hypothetical protein ABZ914_30410 [Spirillospora sp. NPDC046719]